MENIADIESRIKRWDPRDQAEAQKHLELLKSRDVEYWYCDRGRACDGKPHEKYPYKHARGSQWPPPGTDWRVWFAIAGRSWGKTRTGSNWVRNVAKKLGKDGRIAMIARTGPDFRKTMIEGRSGLIKICEQAGETFDWKPALKEFTFQNGAKAFGYSGEEPDSLRGPEHHAAWLDEPSHYDDIEDVWSNLMFGLRLEGLPGGVKVFCSSTPLPNAWTRRMVERENVVVVRGSSYENIDNVDIAFREQLDDLNGSRIGRQEIYGELLEDVEGALWKTEMIHYEDFDYEDMDRIVIAVDPAGTTNKRSDLTGIVVVGKQGERGYVLADLSGQHSPQTWAREVIRVYDGYKADAVIVETNFGGDMVRRNLHAAGFTGRVIESRAVRGKETRAEPIVTKYEQGRIWHSKTADQSKLVDEMLTWVPGTGPSPNRVDAMVWGFSELFKTYGDSSFISPLRLGNARGRTNKRLNPIEALRRERMRS